MKQRKFYQARTLFSGLVIGKDPNVYYVGVPGCQNYDSNSNFSKVKNFYVLHDGKEMLIPNWHKNDAIRTFDDYSGRGHYKLAYFAWKPIVEPEEVSVTKALGGMVGTPEWENLRIKLH